MIAKASSFWPEQLFDEPGWSVEHGQWCALHVRPRTEKVVAQQLHQLQIPYFLPLYKRSKRYQRRMVVSENPLFPGYVFAVTGGDNSPGILIRQVVQKLHTDEPERLEFDLRQIYTMIESGQPVTREERLQPGMPARITAGPLAGLEGQVLRNKGGVRFVVQVQFIQQGTSVELEGACIEAL